MADRIKQQAPWWAGAALAAFASFQQWTLQNNQQLESANGEAIHALIEALGECQEGR